MHHGCGRWRTKSRVEPSVSSSRSAVKTAADDMHCGFIDAGGSHTAPCKIRQDAMFTHHVPRPADNDTGRSDRCEVSPAEVIARARRRRR